MKARDIMSRAVVWVGPDTTVGRIAAVLMEHSISAVPVVDADGAVVGMVSEGDLLGRRAADASARRDWWLALLAEGEHLSPEYIAAAAGRERTAREVMTAPVVTVPAGAELADVAAVLAENRIKRVPVIDEGRVIGIISRADLLRALTREYLAATPPPGLVAVPNIKAPVAAAPPPDEGHALNAADFRHLAGDFHHANVHRREEEERQAQARKLGRIRDLMEHHVADHTWNAILHAAHDAAARGERESLMLRFPAEMCSDGARAINAPEPDWPATLRGEAAEIYQRWLRDLQPAGFRLAARVLDFPGGFPGDVGLFLVWGDER